jgi:hypothetical protein
MPFSLLRTALLFLLFALAPLAPAAAKGLEVTEEQVAALRPGAFLWTTDQPKKGPVTVVISLRKQRAYVYRKKRLVGVSTISSGAKGKETRSAASTCWRRRSSINPIATAPRPCRSCSG